MQHLMTARSARFARRRRKSNRRVSNSNHHSKPLRYLRNFNESKDLLGQSSKESSIKDFGAAAPPAEGRPPFFARSPRGSRNGRLWNFFAGIFHCGLMPTAFTTGPHFSVSAATNLPKSVGVMGIGAWPNFANSAFKLASARPALISLFSLSIISAGVSLGAPIPSHVVAA